MAQRPLLLVAGLVWLVAAAPRIISAVVAPDVTNQQLAWVAPWIAFAIAFSLGQRTAASLPIQRASLLLCSIAAVLFVWQTNNGFSAVLLGVVAGVAPSALSMPLSWVLVVGQCATLFAGLAVLWGPYQAALTAVANMAFQMFCLLTARLAQREAAARAELISVHEQLLAAQEFLAETSRAAERVRIARDLHDAAGHHLTALCLHLEAASHTATGKAVESVDLARTIARDLLADIRRAVVDLRGDDVHVAVALRRLVAGVPRLQVHLDVPDAFTIDDGVKAHAVFRAVQELVTNAVRHADATQVWVSLWSDDRGLSLLVRDDGRGAGSSPPGNGLTGIVERFHELQGTVAFDSPAGRGFTVTAWLPSRAR